MGKRDEEDKNRGADLEDSE